MKLLYIEPDEHVARAILRQLQGRMPGLEILHRRLDAVRVFEHGLAMLASVPSMRPDAILTSFAAPIGYTNGGHVARRARDELGVPVRILSSGFPVTEFADIWIDKLDPRGNVVRDIIVPWLESLGKETET